MDPIQSAIFALIGALVLWGIYRTLRREKSPPEPSLKQRKIDALEAAEISLHNILLEHDELASRKDAAIRRIARLKHELEEKQQLQQVVSIDTRATSELMRQAASLSGKAGTLGPAGQA